MDAHVHAFPDRLALAVREALNREGRLRAGPLLSDVAQGVIHAGFDAAWVLPYAHKAGVAAGINEWSAIHCARFPWLVPGATFHPDDEDLPSLVERALIELRLRVVKLHCSVGNFAPDDPRLAPLWETASHLSVPVVVHAGRRGPGQTAADEIDALAPVLSGYPELPLVLAHAGYPHWSRTVELMEEFPNLCADLTPVWESTVDVGHGDLARLGGRFLFGSDAPNNPVDAMLQARRFESLDVEPEALSMLMGGAASRLVGPAADQAD